MTKINTGNANRKYKDRLFRFVFGAEENKAYLLSQQLNRLKNGNVLEVFCTDGKAR